MPQLPVLDESFERGLATEWAHLAQPGTWWTGPERVAIAATARSARNDTPTPDSALPAAASQAAVRLSREHHADEGWLNQLSSEGLTAEPYVELLAIVARINAVDSFMFGLGSAPRPLPEPATGEPTRVRADDSQMNGGLVPTVGPASAANSLSAVPAENKAMLALHGVLYLSIAEMGDMEIAKSLSRPQMEYVAARTSYLNECFF